MPTFPPTTQIPYFNAPIFLANKTQVGKVDEILGQINSVVSAAAPPLCGGCSRSAPPCAGSSRACTQRVRQAAARQLLAASRVPWRSGAA